VDDTDFAAASVSVGPAVGSGETGKEAAKTGEEPENTAETSF
jgi:hypothetical protein